MKFRAPQNRILYVVMPPVHVTAEQLAKLRIRKVVCSNLARRPVILNEAFCGFLQSLRADAEIILEYS